MFRTRLFSSAGALVGAGVAIALSFNASAAPFTDPNPAVQSHLDAAAKLSGTQFDYVYQFRCRAPGRGGGGDAAPAAARPPAAVQGPRAAPPAPPPMKIFDNLYFVGGGDVMGWALKTSAGIVIFDALNNPDEAKTQIVGGLQKLGLNPSDIKYVVVMHGHGDHWGGAQYLKDTYGATILMSAEDWKLTADYAAGKAGGPVAWRSIAPKHDKDIADGQVLTLGDTSIKFYVTPGHTPGTVSAIFKTTDAGKPHMIGFWGGTGYPAATPALDQYLASLTRFRDLAQGAKVDTLIANHIHSDDSDEHMVAMRANPTAPNPYVLGADGVGRFFGVLNECALAQKARRAGA